MKQNTLKELGNKIKALIDESGLKQKEVAEKANVYPQDLSAFLNHGQKISGTDIILNILDVIGYDIDLKKKTETIDLRVNRADIAEYAVAARLAL